MATTYELISSQTVSTAVGNITFSSIPQTYKDLVLKVSAATTQGAATQIQLYINSSTANIKCVDIQSVNTNLYSSPGSYIFGAIPGTDASNSFGLLDFYISNYSATNVAKSGRATYKAEYSAAAAYTGTAAILYSSTSAITTLALYNSNFAVGSKFYLYGIKNT